MHQIPSPRHARTRGRVTGRRPVPIERLEGRVLLSAVLVKDINTVQENWPGTRSSAPTAVQSVNGRTVFAADDGVHGVELWTTDGTAAGTRLLLDINPGPGQGVWPEFQVTDAGHGQMVVGTVLDDRLYFSGRDGGYALWSTDGTPEGTFKVKDFWGGPVDDLTAFNGRLYFAASDLTYGRELWSTDGTEAGTAIVKDIRPGTAHAGPGNLVAVGNTLYFTADDGVHGFYELFKTDGTAAGTVLVKDIVPGSEPSYVMSFGGVGFGGRLYFTAATPADGFELWRSDGTAAGTHLVKDLYPGRDANNYVRNSWPANFAVVNGKLVFQSAVPSGLGVWTSDGTAQGTVLLAELPPEPPNPYPALGRLIDAGGVAYFFKVVSGASTAELWRTDGTAAGTALVAPLSAPAGKAVKPTALGVVSGVFYFRSAADLWRTDGTAAGTYPIHDAEVDPAGVELGNLAESNGTIYFAAHDPRYGRELWAVTPPAAVAAMSVLSGTGPGAASVPGKVPLLPGQAGSRANLTHNAAGLDAIAIDVHDLPAGEGAALSASDFVFQTGAGGNPATWRTLPTAPTVTLTRGAGLGGSDRVTLTWASGAARNAWLRVTVKPTTNTGLPAPVVFYFGNLVGDAGGLGTPTVDVSDLARTRAHVGKTSAAALATYDFDRDGAVTAADVMIVRNNLRRTLPLLSAPAPVAVASMARPVSREPVRPVRRSILYDARP